MRRARSRKVSIQLDWEIFYALREAQALIERWHRAYSTVRPPPTSAPFESAAAVV